MNKHERITSTEPALPDFYTGTSFAVDEVEIGLRVLQRKIRALSTAHKGRNAIGMKLAGEDVTKVANQIQMLGKTLVDASLRHINRKPRV